jgi:hypothetical protein
MGRGHARLPQGTHTWGGRARLGERRHSRFGRMARRLRRGDARLLEGAHGCDGGACIGGGKYD